MKKNAGKNRIIYAALVLTLVLVSAFALTPTFSKYVLTARTTLHIIATETYIVETEGIDWVLTQALTNGTKTNEYWKTRKNSAGDSLDSTGINWGIPISTVMGQSIYSDPTFQYNYEFFWRMETVPAANGNPQYFIIYFVNEDINVLSEGFVVQNVFRYNQLTDETTIGTATAVTKVGAGMTIKVLQGFVPNSAE